MELIFKICLMVAMVVIACLFLSLPVMWLWNWLMPHLFKLPSIDIGEAIGLNLLCTILFKNSSSSKKD